MKVLTIKDVMRELDELVIRMQTPAAKAAARNIFRRDAMSDIKKHVSGRVVFQYYKDGELWYQTTETDLIFPVPCSDIGSATFLAEDKAILFMRYIRKHVLLLAEKDVD